MATMEWNPQLPAPPQGQWDDAQYESDLASQRAQFLYDYHDALQQLGYTDEQGNVIPGMIDVGAQRQQAALQYAKDRAGQSVTDQSQREGTLFSGIRGENLAKAFHPYDVDLGDLATNTGLAKASALNRANQLVTNYGLGLQGAAARAIGRYVPPGITDPAPAEPPPVTPPAPGGGAPAPIIPPPGGSTGAAHDPDLIMGLPPTQRPGSPAFLAHGAVVDEPTNAVIGEQGPEAVVPLDEGLGAAIQRLIMMDQNRRRPQPGFRWGGQNFADPSAAVNWMNARGADTSLGQFLTNHPALAAQFGQRQAQAAPPQAMPSGPPGEMQGDKTFGQGMNEGPQRSAAPIKPPSVKAAGLKAAAAILREAAKEHEHEAMPAQTPIRPPQRASTMPARRPNPRQAPALRAGLPMSTLIR